MEPPGVPGRPFVGAPETGASPSGKAPDFGSGTRRFESSRPNQIESASKDLPGSARLPRCGELSFSLLERGDMPGELKIFGGRAHPALAQEICESLNLAAGKVTAYNFSDGEIFCQVDENVRGSDVFVVQPTCDPVNENLMELLIMLVTFKRSSASRVTAVIPYYGYARQDKKDRPRVPITAKLVADLISKAGADRVLTLD